MLRVERGRVPRGRGSDGPWDDDRTVGPRRRRVVRVPAPRRALRSVMINGDGRGDTLGALQLVGFARLRINWACHERRTDRPCVDVYQETPRTGKPTSRSRARPTGTVFAIAPARPSRISRPMRMSGTSDPPLMRSRTSRRRSACARRAISRTIGSADSCAPPRPICLTSPSRIAQAAVSSSDWSIAPAGTLGGVQMASASTVCATDSRRSPRPRASPDTAPRSSGATNSAARRRVISVLATSSRSFSPSSRSCATSASIPPVNAEPRTRAPSTTSPTWAPSCRRNPDSRRENRSEATAHASRPVTERNPTATWGMRRHDATTSSPGTESGLRRHPLPPRPAPRRTSGWDRARRAVGPSSRSPARIAIKAVRVNVGSTSCSRPAPRALRARPPTPRLKSAALPAARSGHGVGIATPAGGRQPPQ